MPTLWKASSAGGTAAVRAAMHGGMYGGGTGKSTYTLFGGGLCEDRQLHERIVSRQRNR